MSTLARPVRVKILAAAVVAAATAATLSVTATGPATARTVSVASVSCASGARALHTLSDAQRDLVQLRPTATSVAEINALPRPRRTPTTRATALQRHVWRVRAQIVEYKLERDAAVHLVLYDGRRSYMNAVLPSSRCLPASARGRHAIEAARAFLEGLCGPARPSWRPLGAVVLIDGVGFWASPHGQHGHARNYAELRPVTRIRLVAGCA
jgi:hypothetical protein